MLKLENEYETPTRLNYYQNEIIRSNLQEPKNNQDAANHTVQAHKLKPTPI